MTSPLAPSRNPRSAPAGLLPAALGAVLMLIPGAGSVTAGVTLYEQDFETDDSANWQLNLGPTDAAADIFFDYATVGIPEAPGGTGTRGMKLQANLTTGVFGGMSVSPTNIDLPATYVLEFDWWANSVGPFPNGGAGSTNLSTFGVGTDGTRAQWPGASQNSVWFGGTGDGGSSADWRAYSTAAGVSYQDGDPVYSAATRNSSDPYYAVFGNVSPPAAQAALFPLQTGATSVGAAAFAWHRVRILNDSTAITYTVDGLEIASIDPATVQLSGTNIFFGHSDINPGISTEPTAADLLFTLIDNVLVETITPEGLAPFAIVSIAYTGDPEPTVDLVIATEPGATYAIDFSTALTASPQPDGWQELTDSVIAEGTETTFRHFPGVEGMPQLFYRARRLD